MDSIKCDLNICMLADANYDHSSYEREFIVRDQIYLQGGKKKLCK